MYKIELPFCNQSKNKSHAILDKWLDFNDMFALVIFIFVGIFEFGDFYMIRIDIQTQVLAIIIF